MTTQYSNHRDTPIRRFSSFCWGLAAFGSFGLVSVIAYYSTSGNAGDVETLRATERLALKAEVEAAQSALLVEKDVEAGKSKQVPPAKVFDRLGNEIKSKPGKSDTFVPGSEAHKKQLEALSQGPGDGEGLKLFQEKTCATCHGMDGNRPIAPMYPKLGGQNVDYVLAQMKDFKDGKRTNGQAVVMKPLMEALSDDEMQKLAKWISEQKLEIELKEDHPGAAAYIAKGCVACHGPDAKTPLAPNYPNLRGQSKDYIVNQMKDIKSGARNNGTSAAMQAIMTGVSDDEIEVIAEWLSTPAK
ncbi:cytochrome c [Verrucomicrobiaceae bacterium N1E253]|uniref:Cytochrome c n=1 Tax=Oceaniferula marina TaxID=2748318 RepID=A0A851GJD6_9BACT|nr:cytochrome c [Oceaniferula marina]NWK55217.1 cytochrome c [Oceaniferula marina]